MGVPVVLVAAVVVVAEDVTQAPVVKANAINTDQRVNPDRRQYRNSLGNIATFPSEPGPLSFTLRQTGTCVTPLQHTPVPESLP